MRPLFPPWANSVVLAVAIVGGAAVVGTPLAFMALVRTPWVDGTFRPIEQPVQFDHRHHVLDAGIDCLYCHGLAAVGPTAGVPPTSLCLNCHAQIWNDSPLLAPVRRSARTGDPIPWRRVTDLPDFVFFHHAAHVRRGVACATCHGPVERMARVYAVHAMRMGFCLDCHRDPLPRLVDPARVTAVDVRPGEGVPATLASVDPPVHCSGCHR